MRMLFRVLAWLSFLVGAGLTVLRFGQFDLPLARQALAFVPWALPLFAVAMLIFLGQVYFPGKSRWQITLALAAASMAGLGLHGWWMQPLFAGAHPSAASDAEPVRVFTFNIGDGRADAASIVSMAVSSGSEVVVLQGVTGSMLDRMREAGLGEAFAHQAGEPINAGNFGTMIFSQGTISGVTFLGATQTTIQATLAIPGGSVTALAVGIPAPDDQASSDRWAADLAQLATVARDVDPELIVGNFEASFDHRDFRALLDLGVRDAGERANVGFTRTWPVETSFLRVPLPRLSQPDHVLVGAPLVALGQSTFTVLGADHLALQAEVAFR